MKEEAVPPLWASVWHTAATRAKSAEPGATQDKAIERRRRRHSVDNGRRSCAEVRKPTRAARKAGVKGCMLTKKRFAMLREMFRDYDVKREGVISKEQFKRQAASLMPALLDHADAMFDSVCEENTLGLPEFVVLCEPHVTLAQAQGFCRKYGGALYKEDAAEREREERRRLRDEEKRRAHAEAQKAQEKDIGAAFQQWLSPGKVDISLRTLRMKCPEVDAYELGKWLHQHDKDHNGRLNKQEFIEMLREQYGDADRCHLQRLARALHTTHTPLSSAA